MSTPGDALSTASPLKLRVASMLTGKTPARIISALSGNRIKHHGVWFDVRSEDFSPRIRSQMFWGIYESAETRMIKKLLRDSTTVIELGSSLGVTSTHIASQMAKDGHLICVEANPQLFQGLRERLSPWANKLRVDVVHAAIADRGGTIALALSPETTGSRLSPDGASAAAVEVPALTLRQIIQKFGVADFDLVSDIEGAEGSFLIQDHDALQRCRRAVIELHDTTVDQHKVLVSDLVRATAEAGFRVVDRHGPVVGLSRMSPG
jgi:FkbM family methyltransferase